jgi:hypothetical protein
LLLGALLAVLLLLSLLQVRWVLYVQTILALVLARIIVVIWTALYHRTRPAIHVPVGMLATVALVAGPWFAGALVTANAEGTAAADPLAGESQPACDLTALARHLGTDPDLATRPRTVAAMMDAGPAILYFTSHRVLATPYHRNEGGIVATYDLLNATDDALARKLAEEREVDLILLCPAREDGFFLPTTASGDTTLYGRLLAGQPPSWIVAVPLPGSLEGAHLFELVVSPVGSTPASRGSIPP